MVKKGDYFLATGLGVVFALIMCLGYFGGSWADLRFDMAPVGLLLGCALAFALGIYVIFMAAKTAVAAQESKKE